MGGLLFRSQLCYSSIVALEDTTPSNLVRFGTYVTRTVLCAKLVLGRYEAAASSQRLLVVAIVLSLALPWYPAGTNQAVTQTFTYTYDVPTTSTQLQTIYTLPSPITLEGLRASTSDRPPNFIQDLANVSLATGSVVHVNFVGCQTCLITIAQVFGNRITVYSVPGSSTGEFIVPVSGMHTIVVENFGASTDQVSSVVITADVAHAGVNSETGTNTVSYTPYNTAYLSPILILASGLVSNLSAFFVILAILVVSLAISVFAPGGSFTLKIPRRRRPD